MVEDNIRNLLLANEPVSVIGLTSLAHGLKIMWPTIAEMLQSKNKTRASIYVDVLLFSWKKQFY